MTDILFKTDEYVFSCRVAGILVKNGCVLLQKPANDTGFAFPGGHVEFGETHAQTLAREFREELGVDVLVRELKWVGELFFPWGDRPCQQICLYYSVELADGSGLPETGKFTGVERLEGREFGIEFYWIPLDGLKDIELYPTNAVELMRELDGVVRHFVYRQE